MQTICKFSKNMLLKSQKSKQRIVKGYKNSVFAAYHLEGYLLKSFVFLQKSSQLNIRGYDGFCPFASATT